MNESDRSERHMWRSSCSHIAIGCRIFLQSRGSPNPGTTPLGGSARRSHTVDSVGSGPRTMRPRMACHARCANIRRCLEAEFDAAGERPSREEAIGREASLRHPLKTAVRIGLMSCPTRSSNLPCAISPGKSLISVEKSLMAFPVRWVLQTQCQGFWPAGNADAACFG